MDRRKFLKVLGEIPLVGLLVLAPEVQAAGEVRTCQFSLQEFVDGRALRERYPCGCASGLYVDGTPWLMVCGKAGSQEPGYEVRGQHLFFIKDEPPNVQLGWCRKQLPSGDWLVEFDAGLSQ